MLRGVSISTLLLLIVATAACFLMDDCGDPTNPGDGSLAVTCAASTRAGRVPFDVQFSASVDGSKGAAFGWDFGDGTTGVGANAAKTYNYGGSYNVTVVAKSGNDFGTCRLAVAAESDIRIDQCSAAPNNGNAPLGVKFDSSVSGLQGNPITYSWDFGDGGTSGEADPQHTYNTVGSYTARLTARSGNDAAQCSVPVGVFGPLSVACDVAPTLGQAPITVNYSAAVSGQGECSFHWDFGDRFTSETASGTHRYDDGALFRPTVTARCGTLQGSCQKTVTYFPVPSTPDPGGSSGGGSTPTPATPTPTPTPTPVDCGGPYVFTGTGTPITAPWNNMNEVAPVTISGLPADCQVATATWRVYLTSVDDLSTLLVSPDVNIVYTAVPVQMAQLFNALNLPAAGLSGNTLGTSCGNLQFIEGAAAFGTAVAPYTGDFAPVYDHVPGTLATDLNGDEYAINVNGAAVTNVTLVCWELELALEPVP